MRTSAGVALALALGACTAQPSGSASASAVVPGAPRSVSIPGAGSTLIWGTGAYGLVLLHDPGADATAWTGQGPMFAADRMTVVAPATVTADALRSAITWLRETRRVARVAVLAERGAARAVQELSASDPKAIDQAIVISPPAGLDWRAEFPKLFAASSGEAAAAAARDAADQSAGQWNALLLVAGSASGTAIFSSAGGSDLLAGILRRLDERR